MEAVVRYLVDPLLNADYERVARAIWICIEERGGQPLLMEELGDLRDLLSTTLQNLQEQFFVEDDAPQPWCDDFLCRFSGPRDALRTLTDVAVEREHDGGLDQAPLLLEPLLDLLRSLLANGIYYR